VVLYCRKIIVTGSLRGPNKLSKPKKSTAILISTLELLQDKILVSILAEKVSILAEFAVLQWWYGSKDCTVVVVLVCKSFSSSSLAPLLKFYVDEE